MNKLFLKSSFSPTGDQPQAIKKLMNNIENNKKHQTLLGVTGSGKTFTIANVINQIQKPTLVIAHNKTLAAQLADEFRDFFPKNEVHYFVSYYDYYQPEAYIPSTDTYIEKDSSINDEIERLRHAATRALLTRSDVIIVASVSCIYGIGNPDAYMSENFTFKVGENINRDLFLRHLTNQQYERNDLELKRGTYRLKGDVLEIFPAYANNTIRVEFLGDEVEKISEIDWITGKNINDMIEYEVFPATHFILPQSKVENILKEIESDRDLQVKYFKENNKLIEAQRIEERVNHDMEMIRTTGYCKGVENYSKYFDRRKTGTPPTTLIDYFKKDFLMVIDESHMTVSQIGAMQAGDLSRKEKLVDFGFRLPSAKDNRPLMFSEFCKKIKQVIYTSATPAKYELEKSKGNVIEQLVRPTGLLDPIIEVRKTSGQIDDLISEIEARVTKKQRVLVTTLTKRMAEELSDFLFDKKIKVQYLHSDIDTLERSEILHDLRLGKYDVLVGINLLREGLDLPEVSLVAILDADKEGFLRSGVSLTQTIGRAARHEDGRVIMYADRVTDSMKFALDETDRRRKIQDNFNKINKITPKGIQKDVKPKITKEEEKLSKIEHSFTKLPKIEKINIIKDLKEAMETAALKLEFEQAAELRDEITLLESKLSKSPY